MSRPVNLNLYDKAVLDGVLVDTRIPKTKHIKFSRNTTRWC
jgi:hypothetical protein